MSRNFIFCITAALLALASGCTKGSIDKDSPQKTLSDYVAKTFALKSPAEVAELKSLTTGTAREELDKLEKNEELFKKTFVDEKNSFVSLRIRDERKLAEDRVSITYELTYTNKSPEAKVETDAGAEATKAATEDKITTKKYALFVHDSGKWLISEVKSIKTFVDHESEEKISAEPKTK